MIQTPGCDHEGHESCRGRKIHLADIMGFCYRLSHMDTVRQGDTPLLILAAQGGRAVFLLYFSYCFPLVLSLTFASPSFLHPQVILNVSANHRH